MEGNQRVHSQHEKLAPLMMVTLKITVKKFYNTAPMLAKCDPSIWDALPWDGIEKQMQDLPIHPNLSRMWMELFDRVDHIPLQKLMVEVNYGSSTTRNEKQLS
jgi:hypothetical protein